MDFLSKLTSRKLWAAIVGLITGIALVFGVDEGTISTIAGAVVSAASVITYIITEGKIDAASLPKSAKETSNAMTILTGELEDE